VGEPRHRPRAHHVGLGPPSSPLAFRLASVGTAASLVVRVLLAPLSVLPGADAEG
jgi:hypothetical protein